MREEGHEEMAWLSVWVGAEPSAEDMVVQIHRQRRFFAGWTAPRRCWANWQADLWTETDRAYVCLRFLWWAVIPDSRPYAAQILAPSVVWDHLQYRLDRRATKEEIYGGLDD